MNCVGIIHTLQITTEFSSAKWSMQIILVRGQIPTIEHFRSIFSHINATDEDFTSGNFKPGSGGESSFYKLLIGEITIQDLKN